MKIISITGMPCSGKKILRQEIEKRNIPIIVMGRVVRTEMVKKGQIIDNKTLREYATRIRKVYGYDIVARKAIPHIEKHKDNGIIAIDGVRGLKEIDLFKKIYGNDFVSIGVHSSPRTRFNRMLKRGSPSDPRDYEEFEYRERKEIGWGLAGAIARSDIMLINESTVDQLKERFNKILDKLLDKGNKKLSNYRHNQI